MNLQETLVTYHVSIQMTQRTSTSWMQVKLSYFTNRLTLKGRYVFTANGNPGRS